MLTGKEWWAATISANLPFIFLMLVPLLSGIAPLLTKRSELPPMASYVIFVTIMFVAVWSLVFIFGAMQQVIDIPKYPW